MSDGFTMAARSASNLYSRSIDDADDSASFSTTIHHPVSRVSSSSGSESVVFSDYGLKRALDRQNAGEISIDDEDNLNMSKKDRKDATYLRYNKERHEALVKEAQEASEALDLQEENPLNPPPGEEPKANREWFEASVRHDKATRDLNVFIQEMQDLQTNPTLSRDIMQQQAAHKTKARLDAEKEDLKRLQLIDLEDTPLGNYISELEQKAANANRDRDALQRTINELQKRGHDDARQRATALQQAEMATWSEARIRQHATRAVQHKDAEISHLRQALQREHEENQREREDERVYATGYAANMNAHLMEENGFLRQQLKEVTEKYKQTKKELRVFRKRVTSGDEQLRESLRGDQVARREREEQDPLEVCREWLDRQRRERDADEEQGGSLGHVSL